MVWVANGIGISGLVGTKRSSVVHEVAVVVWVASGVSISGLVVSYCCSVVHVGGGNLQINKVVHKIITNKSIKYRKTNTEKQNR